MTRPTCIPHLDLGMEGSSQDMVPYSTTIHDIESLEKHDFAFVRRRDKVTFTYAIIAKKENDRFVFVMDEMGSVKTLERRHWLDRIRLVNTSRFSYNQRSQQEEVGNNFFTSTSPEAPQLQQQYTTTSSEPTSPSSSGVTFFFDNDDNDDEKKEDSEVQDEELPLPSSQSTVCHMPRQRPILRSCLRHQRSFSDDHLDRLSLHRRSLTQSDACFESNKRGSVLSLFD